jgi:hypothetical protein
VRPPASSSVPPSGGLGRLERLSLEGGRDISGPPGVITDTRLQLSVSRSQSYPAPDVDGHGNTGTGRPDIGWRHVRVCREERGSSDRFARQRWLAHQSGSWRLLLLLVVTLRRIAYLQTLVNGEIGRHVARRRASPLLKA